MAASATERVPKISPKWLEYCDSTMKPSKVCRKLEENAQKAVEMATTHKDWKWCWKYGLDYETPHRETVEAAFSDAVRRAEEDLLNVGVYYTRKSDGKHVLREDWRWHLWATVDDPAEGERMTRYKMMLGAGPKNVEPRVKPGEVFFRNHRGV